MPYNSYPYTLPPLPFLYDALEPHIDAQTLHYHHDKHFQSYITNLNRALEPYPRLQSYPLEQLLSGRVSLPPQAQVAILNNGGGVYNHTLYFEGLSPEGAQMPSAELLIHIERAFGSFERFKQAFTQQALSVFGSGWTFLAYGRREGFQIISLKNQDTLLPQGMIPLLCCDVWEHAYYLQYKNVRADYMENWWSVARFLR